jgi:hypothetical protein
VLCVQKLPLLQTLARKKEGRAAFANDDPENARRVKYYWEIIADNLKKASWSLGYVSAIDSQGRTISLLTRIATTKSVTLCARMKS